MAWARVNYELNSGRVRRVLALLQLKAFDTSTEVGRAQERNRRALLTVLSGVAARGVGVLTGLISIPLTVRYLGPERFGLWMTMSSTIAFLGFADLGLGNGLLTTLAQCNGRDDHEGARKYVSSAGALLVAMAVLVGAAVALAYPWIDWGMVFNIKDRALVPEATVAMACLLGCATAGIPLGLVTQTQMGYQEGFTNSLWAAVGNVLGLVFTLVAIYFRAGLAWLVLAMSGAPVLVGLANGILLFAWRHTWLRPRCASVDWPTAAHLVRMGLPFFVLQLTGIVAYQTGSMVLAHMVGLRAVTLYAVPSRLFSFSPMILSFFLQPMWPAYSEALARGDVRWIRNTLRRTLRLGLAINTPAAILLVAFGIPIIHLWTRTNLTPPMGLMVGLGVWTAMNTFNGAFAMLLNGLNIMRFQMVCAVIMAVANLGLSILLTRWWGVAGLVFATIFTQAVFILLPVTVVVRCRLATLGADVKGNGAALGEGVGTLAAERAET